jgi:fucose 4-O-acetylase-like acetyltransferase
MKLAEIPTGRVVVTDSRNLTVDVAKGLGIVLVALGHNWLVLGDRGTLFQVIYSFHVPLFFVISGIFLRQSLPFFRFAANRADALLKPYFVVLLTWGGMIFLGRHISGGTEAYEPVSYFGGVLYGTGSTVVWAPLWFLPCLFLSSILAWAIVRRYSRARFWCASAALALYGLGVVLIGKLGPHSIEALNIVDSKASIGWPWSLDLVPITAPFIVAGYLMRDWIRQGRSRLSVFGLALAAFIGLHMVFHQTMQLNERDYGQPVISTLQAGLGIYHCIAVSQVLGRLPLPRSALAFIGARSLLVLIFHSCIQDWIFLGLANQIANPYVRAVLGLVCGIAIPLLLWEGARRNSLLKAALLPRHA